MNLLEAIILGIVQGATEFLPVSSSGHSILIPALFSLKEPTLNEVVIAHQGTLLAVLIYFFRDFWRIGSAWLQGIVQQKPFATTDSRVGWFILVGTIPAAIGGILLEEYFSTVFGNPVTVACLLFVTAAFLIIGERLHSGHKTLQEMSTVDALVIGLFQLIALLPGVSRSGSTIVGGLLRGLDRPIAARYSFLLGSVAIAGAGLLSLRDFSADAGLNPTNLIVVFVVSAVVGYACIHFLLEWLKKRSLYPFAIYCILFASFFLLSRLFVS